MQKVKVFLDMDGVIADFVGAICEAHGKESPYKNKINLGVFEIEKLWSMESKEFWSPTNKRTFWSRMDKTPEADAIVKILSDMWGAENIALLTSPSYSGECIVGKREWVAQHFPQFKSRIIFGSAKEFLAGPNRLLIDDRNENVDVFREAGGQAILLPRPWNRCYTEALTPLQNLNYHLFHIKEQIQ